MLVWAKKVPEDGERGKTEYQHAVQVIDDDGRIDQALTQPQRGIPGIDKTARSYSKGADGFLRTHVHLPKA